MLRYDATITFLSVIYPTLNVFKVLRYFLCLFVINRCSAVVIKLYFCIMSLLSKKIFFVVCDHSLLSFQFKLSLRYYLFNSNCCSVIIFSIRIVTSLLSKLVWNKFFFYPLLSLLMSSLTLICSDSHLERNIIICNDFHINFQKMLNFLIKFRFYKIFITIIITNVIICRNIIIILVIIGIDCIVMLITQYWINVTINAKYLYCRC